MQRGLPRTTRKDSPGEQSSGSGGQSVRSCAVAAARKRSAVKGRSLCIGDIARLDGEMRTGWNGMRLRVVG